MRLQPPYPFSRRLSCPFGNENRSCSVGQSHDAEIVAGKASEMPSFPVPFQVLRHKLQIGLVSPEPISHHNAVLMVLQHFEYLVYPISARRIGVSVVYRRDLDALILEKMYEKLYPFPHWYLPRIENRARQGIEFPAAGITTETLGAVLPMADFSEPVRSAVGTACHLDRIHEFDLRA